MFKNKNVIVTGASSGIGLAQAKSFLDQGAIVYAIDIRDNEQLASYKNCHFYQIDAQNICQQEALMKLQRVDILCNTCGVLDDYLPLHEMSDELWHQIWTNNVDSFMHMTKFAIERMLPFKNGVIINMASIAGLIPGGGGFAYTASKHAIVGMTKQLTYDYAEQGIRVNAIAPGAVATPMTAADFQGGGEIAKEVAQRIPVKRYANPEEVAELTMFLASDKASYLHGNIIPIDGGWLQKN